MVPLYEVIQGAQSKKDHAPLVDKAKGIFKNRLCHMKEVSDHVMCQELVYIHVSFSLAVP